MKRILVSGAIAAVPAVSAAQADVSVCVNNTNGKARFAAVCSKKETQQFLKTGGEAPGDVRTISKKVVVPKGTAPFRKDGQNWVSNIAAEIKCSDQEWYLYDLEGLKIVDGGSVIDGDMNYCNSEYIVDREINYLGRQVYCGGGFEAIDPDLDLVPTNAEITLYLVGSCIKK